MSKASKLHTQCLYEDYSYGTSVGTACATSAAATGVLGVSNDVVIVKVDDDNSDRFKEYEALAESIEDEADIQKYQTNTQRAIPYYVCEQYCSNDPACYGFVPDYEFGQEVSTTTFSFSNNNDGIVEYDKVRCILARNASPDTAIMDSTNGLTIPAPCYTKLTDQCISPNEATIERSAEVCDACHDLTDNCFWCEPHKANFFVASTAQPGKCVCEGEASYLISSTQSSSLGDSVFERQAKICKMLLPHNDGYPIDLTNGNNANGQDSNGPIYPSSSGSSSSMQMSYYNETTTNVTNIINTQARSCQAAIEQFRGGSASTNGSNGTQTIAGVTVSSVIVVAVVVSILIPCCICCCLVYLCCFRNKSGHGHGHGRPPTYGSGNAGGHHSAAPARPPVPSARPTTHSTSVPYGNGGGGAAGRPQGHQTTTTTTHNNINNNTNTNTNTNNNPSTTTTTNHHHYYYGSNQQSQPVEAIPVDVINTGVAASSTSPYNPYYYNSTNGGGGGADLEDGGIKPMTYSFSNIEPLPPPSASYEIQTPSTNPNYNNNTNPNYYNDNNDDENEKNDAKPSSAHDGAIMVRVVAPCDMDEGFRFGASYQGQQFEIVAPKGGLRAGQEMIVSVPQRRSHTSGGRQRDTTANGGTTTSNNNHDDDNDDDDMLPVARPVVD